MLLADRPTTSRWAPPSNGGKHSLSSQADPRRQEPRPTLRAQDTLAAKSDRFGARPRFSLRPYANRRPRGHPQSNTRIAFVGQTGSKRTIGSATSRSRGSPTPGDPFATLAITRAPAANPQNVGSRSHLLKWSRRSLSATPRIRCLLVSARSVLTRRSIERSRPVLIRSFRAPPPAATAWPLYPRPAIKFALDADNRLLLDVRPGPKQKCRSRGRLGDQAVTRNETASGWSSSTWALAKRARRCGCLLRCC